MSFRNEKNVVYWAPFGKIVIDMDYDDKSVNGDGKESSLSRLLGIETELK